MKALVVGARGFIGSALTSSLKKAGHKTFTAEPGDLENWTSSIDTVFHLAQKILPYENDSAASQRVMEENQNSLNQTIELSKKTGAHLIFISSSGVYGQTEEHQPVSENQALKPINPNGHNKLISEKQIQVSLPTSQYTIVRLFNAFGLNQKRGFLISALISHFQKDAPLKIRFPEAVRDYIFIDDVCDALLKLMEQKKTGVYNLGSGQGTTVKDILALLETLTGKKARLEDLSDKDLNSVKMEVPYMVADISKIKKAIGWTPKKTLEQGLKKVLASANKPLNVALLGQGNSPHIHNIAVSLAKRGHKVSIIASTSHPVPPLKNVTVHTFSGQASSVQKQKQIRQILKTLSPDILHSHFINYGGLLGVASGFHPHISSAWGCDVLNVPNISPVERLKVSLTLRALEGVLPVSEQLRKRVDELSSDHKYNRIFHWGIDTELFSDSEENRKRADQFLGKIKNRKGPLVLSPRAVQPIYRHHMLLQAWPSILAKHPDAQLVLCPYHSDEDYGQQLRQQIKSLKIEDSVTWIDGLTQQELVGAYLASDVIVSIPSTDGTPLTILETMACERPIVASDIDAVKRWLKPGTNSILVDGADSKSVTEGIVKMFTQLDKDNSYARQIIMEQADRGKCMDQLENIYREIIDRTNKSDFDWLKTIRNISSSLGL